MRKLAPALVTLVLLSVPSVSGDDEPDRWSRAFTAIGTVEGAVRAGDIELCRFDAAPAALSSATERGNFAASEYYNLAFEVAACSGAADYCRGLLSADNAIDAGCYLGSDWMLLEGIQCIPVSPEAVQFSFTVTYRGLLPYVLYWASPVPAQWTATGAFQGVATRCPFDP